MKTLKLFTRHKVVSAQINEIIHKKTESVHSDSIRVLFVCLLTLNMSSFGGVSTNVLKPLKFKKNTFFGQSFRSRVGWLSMLMFNDDLSDCYACSYIRASNALHVQMHLHGPRNKGDFVQHTKPHFNGSPSIHPQTTTQQHLSEDSILNWYNQSYSSSC